MRRGEKLWGGGISPSYPTKGLGEHPKPIWQVDIVLIEAVSPLQ